MGAGNSAKAGGGSNRYETPTPKKSVVTKIKDGASSMLTARRKAAYSIANIIPGMEKGLRTNRTDYRNYLTSKGSTPDFLKDDKNLTSFETYDNLINYKPIQTNPNEKAALNYADYLAEEKGNYNLKMSGNVGGMRDGYGGANDNNKQQIKPIILDSAPTSAEVSQSEAVNATSEEDSIYLRKKKTKARGRSATILSSSKGVKDDDLILGKPSLLGRV